MFRFLVYVLLSVLVISVVRAIIGVFMKGVAELFQPSTPQTAGKPSDVPLSGELKKDPVCGTYVSTATSFRKTMRGEVVYFCSAACRDKYQG